MIVKIFSLLLGLITYPLTRKIFDLTLKNVPVNEKAVMIVFLLVFSLMALGIYFILKKIFGFFYFIGLVIGIILTYKII